MNKYAYVRVSTKDQNVDRQLKALQPYDIPEKNIYCDYQSGKDFERPSYKKMLKRIKSGDLLIIKSIDRLGRNYNDILVQWQFITKQIGADILVLDMSLLDTRKKEGDLTGTLIADLVLQILAYVAQTEREYIHQRQKEGIAAAKEKGKQLGRKPMDMPDNFEAVCQLYSEEKITFRTGAQMLGISHSTFYRRYQKYQAREKRQKKQKKANNQLVSEGRLFETFQ